MHIATSRRWVLLALITAIGLIHLIAAPDQFDEAAYLGFLFLLNTAGSVVAAGGLISGARWALPLGLLIAAGAAVAYIVSRTLGLPGIGVDSNVFEPLGVVAMIAEAGFLAVSLPLLPRIRQNEPVRA